ncbi:alpha/beta fold hydrolase [Candidatus Bipolaricaulota bacterium]|nr:alpha/beta fold hydrolase [Candidatus Bipolaricaulota bacterium]
MDAWKWILLALVAGLAVVFAFRGPGPERVPVIAPAREIEVTFSHRGITLAGTLSLPATPGPHPAVVLVTGSGPQNRDSEIEGLPGYAPFRWIANHLSARGIAVLRYDDRGVGQSGGDFATATGSDFAADAEAAFDFLRHHSAIDPDRIGLLGHSEGGSVAATVAARRPEVAFVVSLAGIAVTGYETIVRQVELIVLAAGMGREAAAEAAAQQREVLDLVVARDWEALETRVVEIKRAQIASLPPEQQQALGDPDAFAHAIAAQELAVLQSDWYREFLVHDPAQDWAKIRVPVLAVFGGLDVQVDAEQNKAALENALARAGNRDVTVVVLPDANHLFQVAVTGAPGEYPLLPMEFHPRLLPTIGDWLIARVGSAVR